MSAPEKAEKQGKEAQVCRVRNESILQPEPAAGSAQGTVSDTAWQLAPLTSCTVG